jgi:TPR repeat protein
MMTNPRLGRALASAVLAVSLTGCTGASGLFCKSEHDNPRVASLMRDSCSGDRAATMQLGLWFEAEEDYVAAARYYRAAATPHSGQTHIYVPPAGEVAGYVMPVSTGPRLPGNAEAQYRLALMYTDGRGVKQNAGTARSYLKQAAEQGHADAVAALAVAGGS